MTMWCREYLTKTVPIWYEKLAGAEARGLTVKAWTMRVKARE
jgi:hypothetical protein